MCVQYRHRVLRHPHHFGLGDIFLEGVNVAFLLYGDEYEFAALDLGGAGVGEDLANYMVALSVLILQRELLGRKVSPLDSVQLAIVPASMLGNREGIPTTSWDGYDVCHRFQ